MVLMNYSTSSGSITQALSVQHSSAGSVMIVRCNNYRYVVTYTSQGHYVNTIKIQLQ